MLLLNYESSSAVKVKDEELPDTTGATAKETVEAVIPSLMSRTLQRLERQREKLEVVGSNPASRAILKIRPFQFRWREPLGKKECPYAYRTLLNLKWFSVRVHEWIRSDDKRYFHDHPWSFITLVLWGGYTDVNETGQDRLRMGSIRYRHATHKHYVHVHPGGALTVLITTPKIREWGFWVKGKFKRPLRFFGKYGHPPCSEL